MKEVSKQVLENFGIESVPESLALDACANVNIAELENVQEMV